MSSTKLQSPTGSREPSLRLLKQKNARHASPLLSPGSGNLSPVAGGSSRLSGPRVASIREVGHDYNNSRNVAEEDSDSRRLGRGGDRERYRERNESSAIRREQREHYPARNYANSGAIAEVNLRSKRRIGRGREEIVGGMGEGEDFNSRPSAPLSGSPYSALNGSSSTRRKSSTQRMEVATTAVADPGAGIATRISVLSREDSAGSGSATYSQGSAGHTYNTDSPRSVGSHQSISMRKDRFQSQQNHNSRSPPSLDRRKRESADVPRGPGDSLDVIMGGGIDSGTEGSGGREQPERELAGGPPGYSHHSDDDALHGVASNTRRSSSTSLQRANGIEKISETSARRLFQNNDEDLRQRTNTGNGSGSISGSVGDQSASLHDSSGRSQQQQPQQLLPHTAGRRGSKIFAGEGEEWVDMVHHRHQQQQASSLSSTLPELSAAKKGRPPPRNSVATATQQQQQTQTSIAHVHHHPTQSSHSYDEADNGSGVGVGVSVGVGVGTDRVPGYLTHRPLGSSDVDASRARQELMSVSLPASPAIDPSSSSMRNGSHGRHIGRSSQILHTQQQQHPSVGPSPLFASLLSPPGAGTVPVGSDGIGEGKGEGVAAAASSSVGQVQLPLHQPHQQWHLPPSNFAEHAAAGPRAGADRSTNADSGRISRGFPGRDQHLTPSKDVIQGKVLGVAHSSNSNNNNHNNSSSGSSSGGSCVVRYAEAGGFGHSSQVVFNASIGYTGSGSEIGLENLGNTCFMNSALQCLLHIRELVDYFLVPPAFPPLPQSPRVDLLADDDALLLQLELAALEAASQQAGTAGDNNADVSASSTSSAAADFAVDIKASGMREGGCAEGEAEGGYEDSVKIFSSNVDRDINLSSPKKGVLAISFGQLVREVYAASIDASTNAAPMGSAAMAKASRTAAGSDTGSVGGGPFTRGRSFSESSHVQRSSALAAGSRLHAVTPLNLQKAVCYYAPYLMDYQQQDCQEFLRFLLDGMSEDLCRKHVPAQTPVFLPISNSSSPPVYICTPAAPGHSAGFYDAHGSASTGTAINSLSVAHAPAAASISQSMLQPQSSTPAGHSSSPGTAAAAPSKPENHHHNSPGSSSSSGVGAGFSRLLPKLPISGIMGLRSKPSSAASSRTAPSASASAAAVTAGLGSGTGAGGGEAGLQSGGRTPNSSTIQAQSVAVAAESSTGTSSVIPGGQGKGKIGVDTTATGVAGTRTGQVPQPGDDEVTVMSEEGTLSHESSADHLAVAAYEHEYAYEQLNEQQPQRAEVSAKTVSLASSHDPPASFTQAAVLHASGTADSNGKIGKEGEDVEKEAVGIVHGAVQREEEHSKAGNEAVIREIEAECGDDRERDREIARDREREREDESELLMPSPPSTASTEPAQFLDGLSLNSGSPQASPSAAAAAAAAAVVTGTQASVVPQMYSEIGGADLGIEGEERDREGKETGVSACRSSSEEERIEYGEVIELAPLSSDTDQQRTRCSPNITVSRLEGSQDQQQQQPSPPKQHGYGGAGRSLDSTGGAAFEMQQRAEGGKVSAARKLREETLAMRRPSGGTDSSEDSAGGAPGVRGGVCADEREGGGGGCDEKGRDQSESSSTVASTLDEPAEREGGVEDDELASGEDGSRTSVCPDGIAVVAVEAAVSTTTTTKTTVGAGIEAGTPGTELPAEDTAGETMLPFSAIASTAGPNRLHRDIELARVFEKELGKGEGGLSHPFTASSPSPSTAGTPVTSADVGTAAGGNVANSGIGASTQEQQQQQNQQQLQAEPRTVLTPSAPAAAAASVRERLTGRMLGHRFGRRSTPRSVEQQQQQQELGTSTPPAIDPLTQGHRHTQPTHIPTQGLGAGGQPSSSSTVTASALGTAAMAQTDDGGRGREGEKGHRTGAGYIRLTKCEREALGAWRKYLKYNDSILTDIFAGQLQSTIECQTCFHKSYSYDPFLDLSVPIHREGEGSGKNGSTPRGAAGFLSSIRSAASGSSSAHNAKSTLEKCLSKFTAEEVLDGENKYLCENCNGKRKGIKKLSIFRYPKVLIIHIKRFRYSSTSREKIATDVHFPMTGLDISPYVSRDLRRVTASPSLRLISFSVSSSPTHAFSHTPATHTPALPAGGSEVSTSSRSRVHHQTNSNNNTSNNDRNSDHAVEAVREGREGEASLKITLTDKKPSSSSSSSSSSSTGIGGFGYPRRFLRSGGTTLGAHMDGLNDGPTNNNINISNNNVNNNVNNNSNISNISNNNVVDAIVNGTAQGEIDTKKMHSQSFGGDQSRHRLVSGGAIDSNAAPGAMLGSQGCQKAIDHNSSSNSMPAAVAAFSTRQDGSVEREGEGGEGGEGEGGADGSPQKQQELEKRLRQDVERSPSSFSADHPSEAERREWQLRRWLLAQPPAHKYAPVYDLAAVTNHYGNLHGGHYIAHVKIDKGDESANGRRGGERERDDSVEDLSKSEEGRERKRLEGRRGVIGGRRGSSGVSSRASSSTERSGGGEGGGRGSDDKESADGSNSNSSSRSRWLCFNDARVSTANPSSIAGPTAYVLFYQLRESPSHE